MNGTDKPTEFDHQKALPLEPQAICNQQDIYGPRAMKFLNTVPLTSVFVGALTLFSLGFFLGRFFNPQETKYIAVDSRPFATQQVLLHKNSECEPASMRPQGPRLTVAGLAEREP